MSGLGSRRRNDEPRAVTKSHLKRANSVIRSCGRASAAAAYGPASPMGRKGSTAIEGRVFASAGMLGERSRAASSLSGIQCFEESHLIALCVNLRHESKTLAVDRPDESLGLAVVAKRLACRLHSTGQGGVGDQASVPDLLEEFIPGNQPLPVLHEEGEKGEHLRLERAEFAFSAQFDLRQIQLEPSKPVSHGTRVEHSGQIAPRSPQNLHAVSKYQRPAASIHRTVGGGISVDQDRERRSR